MRIILAPLGRWWLDRYHKTVDFLNDIDQRQSFAFWVSATIAGLVSVGFSSLFYQAELLYQHFYAAHRFGILWFTPACLLLAWASIAYLSPPAAGSGIPQVLAANELDYRKNNRWVDGLLSIKMILVKIGSALLAGLGGGVLGREGPTIHVSAAIFHNIGRFFRRFHPKTESSSWIVAGAAAGLAAAFNTPLGGIVFAIEEMRSPHFERFKTMLLTSIIISGLASQWILGTYLYLGSPVMKAISFSVLPSALLVGLLSGALGAYYGKGLKELMIWRRKKILTKSHAGFLALGCGVFLAVMSIWNIQTSGSGVEVMQDLLFKGQTASWYLPFVRVAGTLVYYVSGGAGGIFAPSLAAGASVGSLIASLLHSPSANLLVLVGMAAFLTAVTRTPFTASVLVIEMTNDHGAIFPIMVAAIAADLLARRLDPEYFYEWSKGQFLPPAPVPAPAAAPAPSSDLSAKTT
jgi:chloride channel protein, CIC family